jgi:hypothetical protein
MTARESYHEAFKADQRWSKELQKSFGTRARDVRYTKEGEGKPGSELNKAYLEFKRTNEKWRSTVLGTLIGSEESA